MQRGGSSARRRGAPKRSATIQPATSSSNIKIDAQGKIVADQDPAKKFPPINPGCSFVEEYQRNIEDAAQKVRTLEATQSAEPSRLIDNMKASPLQNSRGCLDSLFSLWNGQADDASLSSTFFKDCFAALEADLGSLKQTYKPLTKVQKKVAEDPLDKFSASKVMDHFSQDLLPPPVRTLTAILHEAENQRHQRLIVSKALEHLKKKKPLAELKVDVGKQVQQIAMDDKWGAHDLKLEQRRNLVRIARLTLSGPENSLEPLSADPQKKSNLKRSLVSMYQFLLAKRFPDALRSVQFKSHVDDFATTGAISLARYCQGCVWTIEDTDVLKSLDKYKDIIELKVVADETRELHLANVQSTLGLPFGFNYRSTSALKEFQIILKSFGVAKDLEFAVDLSIKPRNRDLLAAIAGKLQEKASGKQSVQVTQGSTAEINDSDEDEAEKLQKKRETDALHDFLSRGPKLTTYGQITGFGPESVSIRLGSDYGRLRNQFDINRAKTPMLEALPSKEGDPDLPMIYESSEDENMPFADLQRKYRQRFRLYANPKNKVFLNNADDSEEDPVEAWPGSVLTAYKQRIRDFIVKQESPQKRKRARPPGQWRGQTYTLNADGEKVVVEECWKTFSIKPRVRMIESRFDRGGNRPLGFSVKAQNISGSEKQLIGINEAELHRRFALNKLWQVKMVGRDQILADRRYFALVIDEEKGVASVVNAYPTKLIYTDSPKQALVDFNWELYWREAREGKIQSRNARRKLRYDQLKANNYIILKDGLEKYQKLRERVSELQTHENPRDMKLKLLTHAPTIALEEIPVSQSMKAHFDKPAPLVGWAERNVKEVEFRKKIALRTRDLLHKNARGANREFRTLYKDARRCVAERSLYEQAWISSKAKRSTEATLAAASQD